MNIPIEILMQILMKVVASLRKAAEDPFFATDDLMNAWHSRKGPLAKFCTQPECAEKKWFCGLWTLHVF